MPVLTEQRTHKGDIVSNVKAKRAELILFTSQLSVMLSSGIVLSDAVDAIAQQTLAYQLNQNQSHPEITLSLIPFRVSNSNTPI